MPPKKHVRRNSLSEKEIANLMKAHATQSSATHDEEELREESDYKASSKQAVDDKEECKQSSSKKTVSFGGATTVEIPNRDDITEELAQAQHEEYIASIVRNLRLVNNVLYAPRDDTITSNNTDNYCEETSNSSTLTRGRSTSFYIPLNQTLGTINDEDEDSFEDDNLPFALSKPNLEDGLKWENSFIDYDKNA